MKVVGFTIEIKGQKDILATTKVLGLLNTQLILINNTLEEIDKKGGAGLKELNKQFKSTGSSAKQLGTVVKSSFQTFEKGNKVVQDLGNGFFEVTKEVDKTAKEFQELEKVTDSESKSIKDLIARNKELKKVLLEQPIDKTSKQLKELGKEYTKNNDAIKAFRKELRTGKKASDAAEGSLDQLRKRAIDLKKEYNSLGKQQRKTFEGKKIQKELLKTQKRIQKLDLAVRDGRTSIGLYRNATKKLGGTLTKLFVGRSLIAGAGRVISSIGRGLKSIAEEGGAAGKTFENLQSAGAGLKNTLQTVGSNFLKTFGGGIAKIINNVSFVLSIVSEKFTELSKSGGAVGAVFSAIGTLFTEFPAIIGGVASVFSSFVDSIKAKFEILGLGLEKLKLNFEAVIAAADIIETIKIKARLAEIEKEESEAAKRIISSTKDISNAFNEGFKATKEAQEEFQKESIKATEAEEKRLEQVKKTSEAQKKASALRKKRREEEKKDREQALKDIEANAQARIKIALDLETKLRNLQTEALEDSTEKALAKETERFEQERILRRKNFDDIINEIVEEEAKIQALFDENSKEFIAIAEKRELQLEQIRQANNQIEQQQEKQHQEALLQIQKDGDKAKLDAQKKAFDDEVASTDLEQEQEEAAEGAKSDAIIAKQIEGYNKEAEAAKQAAKEQEDIRKQTAQQVVNLVTTAVDAISKISQIAFEAEDARFAKAIETRQLNIEGLNEDLQTATGLQKKFLLQQVKQEEEALAKETEARKKAGKKQAEDQKAIQIVQAIIGGALAIVNAFTLPPPASFIAAAATAIAVGVEIAAISSQQFAKGGILQGPSHAQGGIQTSFGELEGGEAVINKRSTSQFLPLLSEINAAGGGKRFAEGGILTSPVSAPNVGSAQTDINGRFDQFLQASMQQAQATNSRIDRLQVNLDLNNLEDVQDNDSNLDTLTTF